MHPRLGNSLRWIAMLAACLSASAYANPLYKCEVNGKIEFQDRPCANANQKVACVQRDTQEIQYVDKLSEPCRPTQPETFSSGYGGGGYSYRSSGQRLGYGGGSSAGTDVTVRGYTRSDGTYVQGHTRSAPGRGRGK